MDWPDYVVLAVIAISSLVGALRGFIKEVFSLLVWCAAFLAAYHFGGDVAGLLEDTVTLPSARTAMAVTGVFVAVLLVGGLLTYLVGRLVETTGLSGTDRLLGALFGAARGLALVVLLVLVTGFTPIPADPWFQQSRSIARLMPLVEWAATFLPESVTQYLDFDPAPPGEDAGDKAGPDEESEPSEPAAGDRA